MIDSFDRFRQQISNATRFRLFLFTRLPSAFFAGLKMNSMTREQASVKVRYKWFNRNPFGSMYFAVQSMAAEMTTGLLASGYVHKRNPSVSMLVTGIEAKFAKRITGTAIFTCADGLAIGKTINEAVETGEARTIACRSVGRNDAGETASEFIITWSFKVRK